MSNGEVCCILGVCCPPGSAAQRVALATSIKKHHKCTLHDAEAAADRILAKHDCFRDVAALIQAP